MHELNSFFGQVYVINLKIRTDRRAEIDAQLRRVGLDLQRHPVVLFNAVKPADCAGFPSIGAHGCFMSHLQVLRDARTKGLHSILILEDDLNFCDDFGARFTQIADFLTTHDWALLYGSYDLPQALALSPQPCTLADPTVPIGTSAMIAVKGAHIDTLIRYLEAILQRPPGDPAGGPMHVDGAYCWFRRAHPGLATWMTSTRLGYQRSSRTDVHTLRWFDHNPVSAGLVALLRRWRNRLRR